jgi:beta-alanine degradation protein BauB
MKTLMAALLAAAFLAGSSLAASTDPLSVAPEMYKKLFENDQVRVMEVTFGPGGKIPMHSHPDHFAYVVEGGSLRITDDAGKVTDAVLTPGQVLWLDAQSHRAENTGGGRVRLTVTELKGRAAPQPHEGTGLP